MVRVQCHKATSTRNERAVDDSYQTFLDLPDNFMKPVAVLHFQRHGIVFLQQNSYFKNWLICQVNKCNTTGMSTCLDHNFYCMSNRENNHLCTSLSTLVQLDLTLITSTMSFLAVSMYSIFFSSSIAFVNTSIWLFRPSLYKSKISCLRSVHKHALRRPFSKPTEQCATTVN